MAKINGIEIKNLKEFKGHEQETLYQANIYYKGKKVGFWSQDSWGGEDRIDLDYSLPKELLKEVNNILNNYESDTIFYELDNLYREQYNVTYEKHTFKGGEYLFSELLQLLEIEKNYKKYSKLWGVNTIAICYKNMFNKVIRGNKTLNKEDFKKQVLEDKNIKVAYVYDSLEDFKKEV